MAGDNPNSQSTATQQPNIFNQSAGAYGAGVNAVQGVMNPMAVPLTMRQYMNPYQSQVVDDTLGRMRDEMNLGLNDVRGQAAQASAYGGARQGLVEAELMREYQRNMGEVAGGLNQQGFNTAAQLSQNRLGQMLDAGQIATGQAQTGFGLGQRSLLQQQQAGSQQQALMQRILDQASGQYDAFANYPQQALSTAMAGVMGNPLARAGTSTETSSYNPGLYDTLGFTAGLLGGGK